MRDEEEEERERDVGRREEEEEREGCGEEGGGGGGGEEVIYCFENIGLLVDSYQLGPFQHSYRPRSRHSSLCGVHSQVP